jgi:drug/metabolite transporter (DMT)-like permease
MNTVIFAFICVFAFSLYPFLFKKIVNEIPVIDYLHLEAIIISIGILFYLICFDHNMTHILNRIYSDKSLLAKVVFSIILSVISIYIYHILLVKYQVTKIVPYLEALHLVALMLFGWLIFNENINRYRIIGVGFIVYGILKLK